MRERGKRRGEVEKGNNNRNDVRVKVMEGD